MIKETRPQRQQPDSDLMDSMARRTFVSSSLLMTGTIVAWPMSLVRQQATAKELSKLKNFTTTKPWNFDAAEIHLTSLGEDRFTVLRAALCSGDDATCCVASVLVKRMEQEALPLLPELIDLAQDDQSPNWFRAVIAIGKFGESAQVAAPALDDRLAASSGLYQLDVVKSLIQIQPSRLDELSEFLHSALDQCELAFPACLIVGELEERGRRFLPQLESLVLDDTTEARPDIRCEAARAICKITNK